MRQEDRASTESRDDVEIRPASVEDAASFVTLFDALDTESEFMLFEPGERRLKAKVMRERIVGGQESGREMLIVAASRGTGIARSKTPTLDGFVGAFRPSHLRGIHSLNLVLGVRQAASGQGIGTRLLAALEADARTLGIHRLGLGVLVTNTRAIALYERCGFVLEGRRRDAVKLRSGHVDELFMGKIL